MSQPINTPFADLSSSKLKPKSPSFTPTIVDNITAQLGAIARHAETSESLLEKSLDLVWATSKAKAVALYLCNASSVSLLGTSKNEIRFVREAILFSSRGEDASTFPDRIEFDGEDKAVGGRVKEVLNKPTNAGEAGDQRLTIPFFQGEEIRGALVFIGAMNNDVFDPKKIEQAFNEFSAMLELVTDKHLAKTLVDLNAICLSLLSDHPQQCMCGILNKASKMIGCEGISFFAIDPYDESDHFRLVGTHPKPMPVKPVVYSKEDNTLTSRILYCSRDCVVDYTTFDRSQLHGFSSPKWRDVPDQTKSRTVFYVRVTQGEGTAGLLRCTNLSSERATTWFNWVDIRRAKSIASLLLPYYKAAQKEDRFASTLSDISHEIKTMAGRIIYTAQNVRDQIQGAHANQDAVLKLGNIDKAAKSLIKLLPALRMEAALISVDPAAAVRIAGGFKPYADLCKPLAEMFIQLARKRHCPIEYHGIDQLGLIYADIEDFRHILQNLISNAVKYTSPGKTIYIRFQHPGAGGQFASIQIASESLPIRPEEAEFIFKYRQRAQAAKDSGVEGEGIGLAIARAKARHHGGDVIYRSQASYNIFTVLIPRILFSPPNEPSKP